MPCGRLNKAANSQIGPAGPVFFTEEDKDGDLPGVPWRS